jgi:lipopolysaccharide export system protein LptA
MAVGLKSRRSTAQTGTRALRWVLAGLGILLVVVLAGYIAIAHLRHPDFLKGLGKKLRAGVSQHSFNFSYDVSSKGKKIFTVHAAEEAQQTDGKVALTDVGIVFYGPNGEPTNRIHGSDFEYDQKNQLLKAKGQVFIDLVPPPSSDPDAKPLTQEQQDARVVHVKTVGLVFQQKEQIATSDGPVEFRTGGYTGSSVGATYDSKNGVVVLERAVRISGLRAEGHGRERPVVLTASHAVMERASNRIDLQMAKYVSATESGSETASAAHAIVHTTPDGTPRTIDADGDVTLVSDQRGTVSSDRLNLILGAKGQAQSAHMIGNVHYGNENGPKRENGQSADAKLSFDDEGRPLHALLTGGVTFVEQGPASMRDLDAATVELALAGGGKEPVTVRGAEAFGPSGAHLKLVDEDAKGRSATDIRADHLTGRFAKGQRTTELTGLDGNGHTRVERNVANPAGVELSHDISNGDVLAVDFKPAQNNRSELTRAEQRGSVTTFHEAVQRAGPPEVDHGRADDAVYEAQTNLVHMRGSVEIQDETSAMFADRVDVDRGSGDAQAYGAVRVTYIRPPAAGAPPPSAPQEPVHVLAARATAHKASGLAEFFGDAQAKARMWQGASQVEAPVINFYRNEKRLVAHGDPGSDAASVRVVLVNADSAAAKPSDAAQAPQKAKTSGGPIRVVSREMVYTDTARTVEFTGAVRVVDADGTLTAKQATAYLTAKDAAPQPGRTTNPDAGFMGGHVDHLVATGSVVLEQPGRRGTGEKLVYTASDGVFVLTGTKAMPPKVVDATQGTTTGAALRFKTGDDSVEVLGSEDGKSAGRVRSETRMRQ